MNNLLKDRKMHLLLIILVTYLAYVNILGNGFVWDDSTTFLGWPEIRDWQDITELLAGENPPRHEGRYRPLVSIAYGIANSLFGYNPLYYHLLSVFIHLTCTILVYLIVKQMTGKALLAFMTSLLFGVHPIHTEAVTFMSASFEGIGVLFFLISFLLYLKYQKKRSEDRTSRRRKYIYSFSIIAAIIAFLTYELTLTLPLLIVLYEFCYQKISADNWRVRFRFYLPYFSCLLAYFLFRFVILGIITRGTYPEDAFYFKILLLTIGPGFLKYILLTIFPLNLSVSPLCYQTIPCAKGLITPAMIHSVSFLKPGFFIPLLIVLTLAILPLFIRKRFPNSAFWMGWFFITLLPISNIVPFQAIIAERYLYIPSIAFCYLMSSVVHQIITQKELLRETHLNHKVRKVIRIVAVAILFIVVALFAFQTIARNQEWNSDYTLWSRTLQQNPDDYNANTNLGQVHLNADNYSIAVSYFSKVVTLYPDSAAAHNNIGNAYNRMGEHSEAIRHYKKADKLAPGNAGILSNLAAAYFQQNETRMAIVYMKKAVKYDPNSPLVADNLRIISANIASDRTLPAKK